MAEARHLNSLGYVIGGKHGEPLIAWGIDSVGARIRIDEAQRGGDQGLLCDCGTPLVAKKGDIKAHHFAHRAGGTRHCEAATAAAKINFISDALLDAGKVALPVTGGIRGAADVLAVSPLLINGQQAHLVDAQRGRRLLIFFRLRRQSVQQLQDWCQNNGTSGMLVDLTSVRNAADEPIRLAVKESAARVWLYRSEANDGQASPRVLRQIYLYG